MAERNFATERVIIGPCVISFPSLFEPSSKTGKYEIDIIYDRGSSVHKKITELERKAKVARWGSKVPPGLLGLIKNGDEKVNSDGDICGGYEGKLYSKLRTNRQPGVTDVANATIEDPLEVRGGDICVVLAHAYPYVNTEWSKKGVILTLHGVRKIKDGEPLGAAPINAADEMSSYQTDEGFEEF
jgi:hypothetical protein